MEDLKARLEILLSLEYEDFADFQRNVLEHSQTCDVFAPKGGDLYLPESSTRPQ